MHLLLLLTRLWFFFYRNGNDQQRRIISKLSHLEMQIWNKVVLIGWCNIEHLIWSDYTFIEPEIEPNWVCNEAKLNPENAPIGILKKECAQFLFNWWKMNDLLGKCSEDGKSPDSKLALRSSKSTYICDSLDCTCSSWHKQRGLSASEVLLPILHASTPKRCQNLCVLI